MRHGGVFSAMPDASVAKDGMNLLECRPMSQLTAGERIHLVDKISSKYEAIVLAVSHKEFLALDFKALCADGNSVIFDTKSFLDRSLVDARL